MTRARGTRWAYAGAVVGGGVSIAANVAHSFVPAQPVGVTDEAWRLLPSAHPQPGAVFIAAFWPSALLLAIEVLARVDWPRARRWSVLRWGGVTPVAVVAAVVSYLHLSGLLHWYGEESVTVLIGPAGVDGLMVVSTGALLALAARPRIASDAGGAAASDASDASAASDAGRVVASDASVAPIASDADVARVAPDRVEVAPIESHGSGGASDSHGSDRVEDAYSHESDRSIDSHESVGAPGGAVVDIDSHRHTGSSTRAIPPRQARAEDVDRIRAAIKAGELAEPLRVSHVMERLSIGPTYARAAIEQANAEGPQEQEQA